MSDKDKTTYTGWSYAYQKQTEIGESTLNLEKLENAKKELATRLNDDISRTLFASPSKLSIDLPLPKAAFYNNENQMLGAMPVLPYRYTPWLPQDEGVIIYGDIWLGTGEATNQLDNLGLDLTEEFGIVFYNQPAWAMYAILAAALLLITLVLA